MTAVRGPAKLNLCLYLGGRREDGLHELVSVFCPLSLADELTIEPAEADEVICPGVEGPNLAAAALAELRARGWAHPPVRIEIRKRIPVAAGLGGGSADAAAVLRFGLAYGDLDFDEVFEVAAGLGSDVPSQLRPDPALVRGGGEVVNWMPGVARDRLPQLGVVLVPSETGLATADVYAEADRLGLGRSTAELEELRWRLWWMAVDGDFPLGGLELVVNDLEPAALSLRPEIGDALEALKDAGAIATLVAGSGPTTAGLFADAAAAERAAAAVRRRFDSAFATSLERRA